MSAEGLRSPWGIRPVLYYPTLADPRFISVALLLGLDLYAWLSPSFGRHLSQWLASVGSFLVTDIALLLLYKRILLVPLSGLVPSLAAFCLLSSPSSWAYALVGVSAMLSKHFIRVDGRHLFNPLNFGLVIGLLFFRDDMAFNPGRWASPWLFPWVGSLGLLAAWRSRRLDAALAYAASFLLGAGARALLAGRPFAAEAAPVTGIAFYLHAFHMVTDPKTTPDSRPARLAFAVLVGLFETGLRLWQAPNAPLYALFIVSGFLPLFRRFEGRVPGAYLWRIRALRLSV